MLTPLSLGRYTFGDLFTMSPKILCNSGPALLFVVCSDLGMSIELMRLVLGREKKRKLFCTMIQVVYFATPEYVCWFIILTVGISIGMYIAP